MTGFEPANGGFADHSLCPLGYICISNGEGGIRTHKRSYELLDRVAICSLTVSVPLHRIEVRKRNCSVRTIPDNNIQKSLTNVNIFLMIF